MNGVRNKEQRISAGFRDSASGVHHAECTGMKNSSNDNRFTSHVGKELYRHKFGVAGASGPALVLKHLNIEWVGVSIFCQRPSGVPHSQDWGKCRQRIGEKSKDSEMEHDVDRIPS